MQSQCDPFTRNSLSEREWMARQQCLDNGVADVRCNPSPMRRTSIALALRERLDINLAAAGSNAEEAASPLRRPSASWLLWLREKCMLEAPSMDAGPWTRNSGPGPKRAR